MRFLTFATAILLSTMAQSAAPAPQVAGLWSWHHPWTSAPEEIVKDSGPNWYASGLLLNLCDDGHLRMATGVFYRGTGSATLGSSDGLSLYEGEWAVEGDSIVAKYHLVDSEIPFSGMELAKRTQIVERLHVETGEILFAFHRAGETAATTLRLTSSKDSTQSIEDRFVECTTKTLGKPSNKSLERMRAG